MDEQRDRYRQAYTPRGFEGPCVFCAVVAGDEPADEVHRSAALVAFLDHHPLFPGHVLLVPVVHVQTYDDLPVELADEWLRTGQALQRAVEAATGSEGALMVVNNVISQSVPHVHQHVVPRDRGDGLRFFLGPRRRYEAGQAGEVAAAIRAELADAGSAGAPARPSTNAPSRESPSRS